MQTSKEGGVMYEVYGKKGCPLCVKSVAMIERFEKVCSYIDIEEDGQALGFIVKQGFKSLPQIYYNDKHIGGYNDLQKHILTI